MKKIVMISLVCLLAVGAGSCNRKSGCPANSEQGQMDNVKKSKKGPTSGLLPPAKKKKKR